MKTVDVFDDKTRWLGVLVVMALDSRPDDREFGFPPPQLIMGWVTVFGRENHLSISPSHLRPSQPPTRIGTGNKYQPNYCDVLQLPAGG